MIHPILNIFDIRIISYGRRRRDVANITGNTYFGELSNKRVQRSVDGGSDEEELLVTHSFKIHDNFDKEKSQLENKEKNKEKILNQVKAEKKPRFTEPFHEKDSFSFSEETFDPNNVEVCMNVTCLIAGVAVLLILQLIFIFVWTHFLQRRNRKKFGLPAM